MMARTVVNFAEYERELIAERRKERTRRQGHAASAASVARDSRPLASCGASCSTTTRV